MCLLTTMHISIVIIVIIITTIIINLIDPLSLGPDFTVPQKGYAKRGSNRQITKTPCLSHSQVTSKSLKSNLFLEPLLAYPFWWTVNYQQYY